MGKQNIFSRPTSARLQTQINLLFLAVNGLVLAAWLLLFRPVFAYLSVIFTREEFRTNQIVLLGVVILLAARLRTTRFSFRPWAPPHFNPPALALALGASGLFLLVERFLNINTLSAVLFGLATYGLVGLWLPIPRWRQGFLAALLLIGVLPFGEHLQTFVGYPLRILTASVVQDGLSAAGVQSLGIDTILVFENGVSQVDSPCSGVKSLWTGMLFLLAATWIERRPLGLRWGLIAIVFAGLLLAEMLHVPLGVIGFVAACAAALFLLRRLPDAKTKDPVSLPARPSAHPLWLAPTLAVSMLAMALLYTPRPLALTAQSLPTGWTYPAALQIEPMPLSPAEIEWITSGGAEAAERVRFDWEGIQGSMILITSQSWRGQHRPERCFEVYGLTVETSETQLVTDQFPLRSVTLSYAGGQELLTAAYWFQSSTRITDDYATRIWADLSPSRERWVLVTILFDHLPDRQPAELQAFYTAMQTAVTQGLRGDLP